MENFTKLIFWIQILIAPFLIGVISGLFVLLYFDNIIGIIGGALLTILGAILGVRFAENARKKHGTVEFSSKIMETPELNKKTDE